MDTNTLLLLSSPLIIGEIVMKVIALISLHKREKTKGPKIMWVLLILFVNTIGWILYFVLGRED